MGALKLTACMKVVSEMSDLDRDALLDRLDGYLDDGVPKERAQVMAASDMLAELEDERREFMRMLKEQHPEIFVVTAPKVRQSADRQPLPRGYVGPMSDEEREQGRLVGRFEDESYKAWRDGSEKVTADAVRWLTERMRKAGIDEEDVKEVSISAARSLSVGEVGPGGKYDPETHPYFSEYRAAADKLQSARVTLQQMVDARVGPPEFDGMRQLADFDRPQVRTPEFRRWFKNSKVVDNQGRPLIVFHGTNKDLTEFATVREDGAVRNNNWFGQLGSWFAAPQPGSEGYDVGSAEATADVFAEMRGDEGSVVYPVYLSIQNPYDVEGYDSLVDERDEAGGAVAFRAMLVEKGYDGVVVRESSTDGGQYRDDWVAFYPTQIKSAIGNSGAFATDNPDIRKSSDRTPLGFYSALARSIDGVPIKSAPAGAWKTAIKGLLNKGAVKQDELEWSGLEDWMDLQQGKISKEQVAEYLKEGGVQVEETTLGESLPGRDLDGWLDRWAEKNSDTATARAINQGLSWDEIADVAKDDSQPVVLRLLRNQTNPAKYGQYTLPGGENYREVLLTLPAKQGPRPDDVAKQMFGRRFNDLSAYQQDQVRRMAKANDEVNYRSSHWDQPNVLAHIRVNDRTDADGNRVLFVEELQSDWGQEGKKQWFKGEPQFVAGMEGDPNGFIGANASGVPKAPFVTKTEGWLNLALKRVMVMAAEGGYDKVAFTDAEPHFKRWGTERIDWAKQPDGSFLVRAKSQHGGNAAGMNLEAEAVARGLSKSNSNTVRSVGELEDTIRPALTEGQNAEDLAPKIWGRMQAEDAGTAMPRREGFEAFYGDKSGMNPKTGAPSFLLGSLKKLLPKVGGGQVGVVEIDDRVPGSEAWMNDITDEDILKQPGFDVTDAMREKVAGGLPLFSPDRAQTQTPEFKSWFGDSDAVNDVGQPLVVYTATNQDFDAFEPGRGITRDGIAAWVSVGPEFANQYASAKFRHWKFMHLPWEKDYMIPEGLRIIPAYVNPQRPFDVTGLIKNLAAPLDEKEADAVADRLGVSRDVLLDAIPEKDVFPNGYEREHKPIGSDLVRTPEAVQAIRRAGYDSVKATEADAVVYALFDGSQIKSAIGNVGAYGQRPVTADEAERLGMTEEGAQIAQSDGDIRFSADRADRPWFDDLSKLKISTNYQLGDLLKSSKKLSWWDRTVGTQYNLAQRHPQFKRVFDAVQTFINDVSAYATRAADLAPTILPKLETLKDITKSPLSAEDVKALRDPIFGGTLKYTRDDEGNIIEADDVSTAGVVFTNDELRDLFGLNDRQVKLYREFRRATNKSLTDLAVSDMLRYLGADSEGVRQRALEATNLDGALNAMVAHLDQLIEQQPKRAEVLEDSKRAIKEKAGQAIGLMARGYAPLSRFGQYTVYVVGKDGEQIYFSMFENERDANKMAREMREQYPEATVTTGTMSTESYKLFSGVTPETLALFGESLGLEESGVDAKSEVFQQYLKMAKTNRSAMKRLIQRKGIDGFSEDAGRVLAGFVYSNARQISTNLHAGEISRSAAAVTDGDVKDAAIRLMEYVQNPMEEAQAIRGLMFTQFIGGSIASAMVNMTQPFTMTMPYLSQFDGVTGAAKRMADAVKLVSRGIRNDEDLQKALKRAEQEGVVSPQEVHQLMAQAQGKGSLQAGDGTKVGDAAAKVNNAMAKLGLVWGKLFSAAEQFNRRVTFIAAYKLAREQGMDNPFAFAENAIAETQGVYNKGNKPKWARGAVGSTLFTFKQYSIAYMEFLVRMWGNGPEGKKAVGLALGVLFLTAGLGGLPGMDDLDDVIDGFMQRVLGKSFDSKQAKKEFLASLIGQNGAEFVMSGLSGLPGAPIDISGRMGLGNLIPGTGLLTKKRDYGRDYLEIVGPAGTLFSNAGTAVANVAQGELKKAAEVLAPVAAQNVIKSVDMAQMGYYRDMKGRKVIDTDGFDALAKAIGFQPRAVAQVQEATFAQQSLISQNKLRETEIADKWARGRIERKPDLIEEAKEELAEWNRKNPESPIRIDAGQINRRVQQAMMDKAKRIEKTAPKEIRSDVKRQLESELRE